MHLAERAYFLVALTGLMAIAGIWSADRALVHAWAWPASVLLVGLAVESWWRSRYRLAASLNAPNRLLLGHPATLEFTVHEISGRAVEVEYARSLPAALVGDTTTKRATIPAGGFLRENWRVEPVRLGPSTMPSPSARLLGRWGLAWWHADIALSDDLSVAPDTVGAESQAMPGNVHGDAARRRAGMGSELFQLRDYVPGDPLARIDWKASARRRALVSREFTEDQHLEIVVILDAGRMSRVRAGNLDRLGLYANVAARFAEHAIRLDDRVGLVAYSDRIHARVAPSRGLNGVRQLRSALERMRTVRSESRPLVAVASVQQLVRARSLIIWLCDFAEPETAPDLMRAVRALRTTHFVIVASVEARELDELTSAPARSWRDPWIAIAAAERKAAMDQHAAQLRERGAIVLSASEAQLEARVLDTYTTQRRLRRL
jgi:uncharacterized protein (DUF58 family)